MIRVWSCAVRRRITGWSGTAPPVVRSARAQKGHARPVTRRSRCYHRRPMPDESDRARYYLTTAIAYANNKPGLHTLYEVIGADVDRALAPDARRRHAVPDRDGRALDQHRPERGRRGPADAGLRGREGRLLQGRRGRPRRSARTGSSGRPTPTTSGRPRRWSAGRTPTATSTSAPTRAGTAPTRASGTRPTWSRRRAGTICPNHPDVPLQWLTERNWFFRLSAYQERLERHFAEHPDFVQPDYRRNEMLGFIRGGLEDFSISRERTPGDWGIPFPVAENGEIVAARGRHLGSRCRQDLRLVRRAHQLHHRGGLPRRPGRVRALVAGRPPRHRQGHRPVPHDLLAGHAVERRSRGAAPRLGPRLAAGRRRRTDEQEPRQLPRPQRLRRGLRPGRRAVRGAARGPVRPRRRGELGLVRPALQRRPRQRLREPRQPDRVDDQPLPGRRPARADRRRVAGGRLGRGAAGLRGPPRALPPPRCARGAVGVRRCGEPPGRRGEAMGAGQARQGR